MLEDPNRSHRIERLVPERDRLRVRLRSGDEPVVSTLQPGWDSSRLVRVSGRAVAGSHEEVREVEIASAPVENVAPSRDVTADEVIQARILMSAREIAELGEASVAALQVEQFVEHLFVAR